MKHILLALMTFLVTVTVNAQDNFTSLSEALLSPGKAKHLDLSGQDLKEIPKSITKLKNLEYLDISNNQLKEIPFFLTDLKKLTFLDCSHNQITDADIVPSQLKKLKGLSLSHNQLTKITANFPNVENLYLENNQITKIELLHFCKNLKSLKLSDNQLSFIDIPDGESLENLNLLNISNNEFDKIPFFVNNSEKLTSLYASGNKLKFVPNLKDKEYLSILDLSNNQITFISDQDKNTVVFGDRIKSINLSNNQLTMIPESFGQFTNLEKINVSKNNFSDDEKEKIKKMFPSFRLEL
ncbi:MAG: leucine-rich repeat domain-containing protein [Saprospiraceae bacterium]|nr:leucine-rich repeat domain-containing protein [Saprospiraceae bacterium]